MAAETAFDELAGLMAEATKAYNHAKRKALRRMSGLIYVSYLIGGVGVTMLTLQAYGLLKPSLELLGISLGQGPESGGVNYSASIATVLTLAGISLAAWIRNRGYLTQFLRYAIAASEMEILAHTFKLELPLTDGDAARAKLARETLSKFAEIVRQERSSFAASTNQDIDRIIGLIERASETAAKISRKP